MATRATGYVGGVWTASAEVDHADTATITNDFRGALPSTPWGLTEITLVPSDGAAGGYYKFAVIMGELGSLYVHDIVANANINVTVASTTELDLENVSGGTLSYKWIAQEII